MLFLRGISLTLFVLIVFCYAADNESEPEPAPTVCTESDVNSTGCLPSPAVTIKQGKLRGLIRLTPGFYKYYAYLGIPYSKVVQRFEPPQDPDHWTGTRWAIADGNICVQMSYKNITIGKEDCLYLNVYTRQLPTEHKFKKLKPVMVWIHGGDFISGSSHQLMYGPDYFLEKDVVVVAFNYRLGIFGFLSTGDKIAPGNNGLRDQIQALKWVKENIAAFGGNPNNVTIFGESAGAASVHYLVVSPLAKGLFHGAIAESGTTLVRWAVTTQAKQIAQKTAERLLKILSDSSDSQDQDTVETLTMADVGDLGDSNDIVKLMRKANAGHLLQAAYFSMLEVKFNPFNGIPFTPVIEADEEGAVISSKAYKLLKSGNFSHVPLIIGYNSGEGLFILSFIRGKMAEDFALKMISAFPQALVPPYFNIPIWSPKSLLVGKIIFDHYFKSNKTMSFKNAIDYTTDIDFVHPIVKTATLHAQYNPQTYLYQFSYQGGLAILYPHLKTHFAGVPHSDEMGYLWRILFVNSHKYKDTRTRDRMVTMWTNFAKTGNPTPTRQLILGNVQWPALNTTNDKTIHMLNIDEAGELVPQTNPFAEQIEYWDALHKKFGQKKYL